MSTEVVVEEKNEVQKSTGMAVEGGVYTLSTVGEQMTYAQWLIDKRLVSETFKTPAQLVVAIQLCKDLDLPNSALSCFYVVGGKPAIFGDVLIGLVMGSGLVEDKNVSWFDADGALIERPKKRKDKDHDPVFGCEVGYKRKGHSTWLAATYTLDDKEDSKTVNPTWVKFWKDMLWRRADVRAIKALFPDCLKGIEVVEYLEDVPAKILKGDTSDRARKLTEKFSDIDQEVA